MQFSLLKNYLSNWRNCWQIPLTGIISGFVASLLHIPLPWMIGSLLGVIILQCIKENNAFMPVLGGRKLGQYIIGIGLGLHFTRSVMAEMLANLPLIICCTIITLIMSIVLNMWALRGNNFDKATVFFASLPGGTTEMVNIGTMFGGNASIIVAAHSLRILLMVIIIPPAFSLVFHTDSLTHHHQIANWQQMMLLCAVSFCVVLLWIKLKQPNPWLLGSLFACAAGSVFGDLQIALSPLMGKIAQCLLGCSLGCSFNRGFFRSSPKFLLQIGLATILMMIIVVLLSVVISNFVQVNYLGLILGMMPGGITELTLTAEALSLSVALVASLHILRIVLIIFLALPVYRFLSGFK